MLGSQTYFQGTCGTETTEDEQTLESKLNPKSRSGKGKKKPIAKKQSYTIVNELVLFGYQFKIRRIRFGKSTETIDTRQISKPQNNSQA
jgi:hypothetical protein